MPELTQEKTTDLSIITPTNAISYTLDGLESGLYRICATGIISETDIAARNCYDNTGQGIESAQDISTTTGITITNIDVGLTPTLPATISGTITSFDGRPLKSFMVTAIFTSTTSSWRPASQTVRTDSEGQYELHNLIPGRYKISLGYRHDGLIGEDLGESSPPGKAQIIELASGETRTNVDGFFGGPVVMGTVTTESGEPVAHMGVSPRVNWFPESEDSHYGQLGDGLPYTDENGQFQLPLVLAGQWTLYFTRRGDPYIDEYLGNVTEPEDAQFFTLTKVDRVTNIHFVVRTGATVTGTITVEERLFASEFYIDIHRFDGDEWIREPSVYVKDGNGNFSVQGLVPGRYKFAARADATGFGFYQPYGSDSLETATEFELDAGDTIADINIDFKTNEFDGELAGTVSYQGNPVENILISIEEGSRWQRQNIAVLTTDADGSFSVGGLRAGTYCVRISDPNDFYASENFGRNAADGICELVALVVGEQKTNLDHELRPSGSLQGRVKDVEGKPIANVQVALYGYNEECDVWKSLEQKTTTDENGQYAFAGLYPQTYRIRYIYLGDLSEYSTQSQYYGGLDDIDQASNVQVVSQQTQTDIDYVLDAYRYIEPAVFMPLISISD